MSRDATSRDPRDARNRTGPRPLVAGVPLALALACFAPGCGPGEPQVGTDVPEVKIADTPDYTKGKLPKGMPKTTTAGMKIDPATGRPVAE